MCHRMMLKQESYVLHRVQIEFWRSSLHSSFLRKPGFRKVAASGCQPVDMMVSGEQGIFYEIWTDIGTVIRLL